VIRCWGGRAGAGRARGGNKDELLQMIGKGAEDRMGIGLGVDGGGEAGVEAVDGLTDRVNGFLGGVPGAVGVMFLPLVELFEFAEGFGFFGFGGVAGIEDGFEFLLFVVECAHGLSVVEGEAAFLEASAT